MGQEGRGGREALIPSVETLVRRAKRRDESAFAELHRRCAHRVFAACMKVLGKVHDAEDVSQQAWMQAWRKLPGLREPKAFRSWVARIARNLATNYRMGHNRRYRTDYEPTWLADTRDPSEPVVQSESVEAVRAAVARLSPRYKAVVVQFYFEDATYLEMAAALGIPLGTVKSRLSKARKVLADLLPSEQPACDA